MNTGDNLTMICNGLTDTRWFFQHVNPLPPNITTFNQFLSIEPVSIIHEGTYTCYWTAVIEGMTRNFLAHSSLYIYGMPYYYLHH